VNTTDVVAESTANQSRLCSCDDSEAEVGELRSLIDVPEVQEVVLYVAGAKVPSDP
jgi:hypothetical protein